MKTSADEITLERTCFACPEQYDAYFGAQQVGYLRLRHGYFRVAFPDIDGETIYEAETIGDGIFDESERELHLTLAKQAIAARLLALVLMPFRNGVQR